MKSKSPKPTSYRVDILLPATDTYALYTSAAGVDLGMAESLAAHLKRNGAGGRIVEIPGDAVREEWPRTHEVKPPTYNRDAIQALRDKANKPTVS